MNLDDKCIRDLTAGWTQELKSTILFMEDITYDKTTKSLDMKNLRLSSMVLVDNQFSSLNVWGLDPDSY